MQYGRAGQPPALADVSFEVGRGEIVGLLGPNGAGKTTMLRILTCFLQPTGGTADIAGHSIAGDPLAVRRSLGYLPEGVPLYDDMRVIEYLSYRAALRGVERARRRRQVDAAVEQCGLGDRRRQTIRTLSRGFRQRVGLADAVLARPPVLILDEPTVGLDPNQIREVRELIRALAHEQTILLSTHILPEVEALASRVLILHRGRLVADQPPAQLRQRTQAKARLVVEVRPDDIGRAGPLLRTVPGVTAVVDLDSTHLTLEVATAAEAEIRDLVFQAAAAAGLVLRELRLEPFTLEEVFTRITMNEPADA
jgi:ABC-2 type transport system ATP-binding protein